MLLATSLHVGGSMSRKYLDIIVNLADVVPVLALVHPLVVYPHTVQKFVCTLEDNNHIENLMADIRSCEDVLILAPSKPGTQEPYGADDIYPVGVVAHVTEMEMTAERKL